MNKERINQLLNKDLELQEELRKVRSEIRKEKFKLFADKSMEGKYFYSENTLTDKNFIHITLVDEKDGIIFGENWNCFSATKIGLHLSYIRHKEYDPVDLSEMKLTEITKEEFENELKKVLKLN